MAKAILATALVASAATGPLLPRTDGIDQTADQVRLALAHDIRAHQRYVHEVRATRRREARIAAREARAAASPPDIAPSPSGGTYSADGWGDELAAVGFPASAIPTMEVIIQRESGGDPSAMNASGACGLTQIYPYVPGCLDPMTNLRLAYEKYQAAGFAPWATTAP